MFQTNFLCLFLKKIAKGFESRNIDSDRGLEDTREM